MYCNCKDGYIENPTTGICVEDVCLDKCTSCVLGDSTQCAECAVSTTRQGIENNCDC